MIAAPALPVSGGESTPSRVDLERAPESAAGR